MDQSTSPEPIFSGMLEPLPIWAKPKDLWRWWENRRLIYNSIVGLTAMFSFFAFEFFANGVIKPGEDAAEPMGVIAGIILVPILWNLAYCLGPIVDIIFHQIKLKKSYGPLLFKVGVAFSVALLCVPSGAYFVLWVQQAMKGALNTGT